MNDMTDPVEIGLPSLSEEDIERLAESCELQVTEFIFGILPMKSIEDLSVVCSLELTNVLDLTIDIDIIQKYDTNHDLDEIIGKAIEYGSEWLEKQLLEMKTN